MKVLFKKRTHGMTWTVGDLADFRVNDQSIANILRVTLKKIRVLMPLEKFSVFNNSSKFH